MLLTDQNPPFITLQLKGSAHVILNFTLSVCSVHILQSIHSAHFTTSLPRLLRIQTHCQVTEASAQRLRFLCCADVSISTIPQKHRELGRGGGPMGTQSATMHALPLGTAEKMGGIQYNREKSAHRQSSRLMSNTNAHIHNVDIVNSLIYRPVIPLYMHSDETQD